MPSSGSAMLVGVAILRVGRGARMSSGQQSEQLHAALNNFGRRERQLSAANLEHHRDVLTALFGAASLEDVSEERLAAQRVEHAIRQIIESYADGAERRAAEVVFASQPEFHGLYVGQRIAVVEANQNDRAFTADQYPRLRKRVVANMTTALPHALAYEDGGAHETLLSPVAKRAARQLYRYAQPTLVALEAFNDCVRFESELRSRFSDARGATVDLIYIDHGWLGEYGKPGEDFRLVPVDYGFESDEALWAFAYYNKYRRALLGDPTGRDYLRENLAKDQWLDVQRGAPFPAADIEVLESALVTAEIDEATAYVVALCQDDTGRAVNKKWMELLTTNVYELGRAEQAEEWRPTSGDRSTLIWDLLGLCIALQGVFPKDTLMPDEDYTLAVGSIVSHGLWALDIPMCDEALNREDKLAEDIASRRPARYVFRDEDEPTWTDELPEQDPWAY